MHPLEALIRRDADEPEGLLLDAGDTQVTNAQALAFVRRAASYLQELGVRPGHSVALNLPIPLHILFMLATWHEAAMSVAFSKTTSEQVAFKPDLLISAEEYPSNAAGKTVLFNTDVLAYIESLSPSSQLKHYPSNDSVCRILYSSGTTGTPKGVPFTPAMMQIRAARSNANWLAKKPFMSLFDIGALGGFMAFFGQLTSGDVYLVPGRSIQNVTQIFQKKVSYVQGSPQQITSLLNRVERDNYTISSVREVATAGAISSTTLAARVRKLLNAEVLNVYGSTEAGAMTYREQSSDNPFDMGVLFGDVQMEAVDVHGHPVPAGEVGELRCKSPAMTSGYFEDPDASSRFFRNGWYYPGDTGRIMPDGRLILEGRVSELVNLGGVKVDPARTEEFATSLNGVSDAGAFGFNGSDGAEQLGLAVVPGPNFDASDIQDKLRQRFGTVAPSEMFIVKEIPRNSQGKVQRQHLAQSLAKH